MLARFFSISGRVIIEFFLASNLLKQFLTWKVLLLFICSNWFSFYSLIYNIYRQDYKQKHINVTTTLFNKMGTKLRLDFHFLPLILGFCFAYDFSTLSLAIFSLSARVLDECIFVCFPVSFLSLFLDSLSKHILAFGLFRFALNF